MNQKRTLTSRQAITLTLSMMLSALANGEEAVIYMDETVIQGNEELPKVLYIVPWRDTQGAAPELPNPPGSRKPYMEPIFPHEYKTELARYSRRSSSAFSDLTLESSTESLSQSQQQTGEDE